MEATLEQFRDHAIHRFAVLESLPDSYFGRLFLRAKPGEYRNPFGSLAFDNHDINFHTDEDVGVLAIVEELSKRDNPFRLRSDVDNDVVLGNLQNNAFDDIANTKLGETGFN